MTRRPIVPKHVIRRQLRIRLSEFREGLYPLLLDVLKGQCDRWQSTLRYQPFQDAGEQRPSLKMLRTFVISSGNAAVPLEAIDGPLHLVALAILLGVIEPRPLQTPLWGE